MKCPSCSRILLENASFCPYCGETNMTKTAAPKPAPAPAEEDADNGSTMVMQITPEMLKAELYGGGDDETGAAEKPAAKPGDIQSTVMGMGLPSLTKPEAKPGGKTKAAQETIVGVGLEDIMKAQRDQSAPEQGAAPLKAKPPKDSKATIVGVGLEDIVKAQQEQKAATKSAAPLESKPPRDSKATIAGLGLDDIMKAQAASKGGSAPAEAKEPVADVKATMAGFGLDKILDEKAKGDPGPGRASQRKAKPAREAKATIAGLGLEDIMNAQAAAKKTRDNEGFGELEADGASPAPIDVGPDNADAFSNEVTNRAAHIGEFHPADALQARLARELPALGNDIETLQFLPPAGGLFSLFSYAKLAKGLKREIAELRETLSERRSALTNEKSKAYRELGRIGWMKGIRIVGLDSYVSELAFYKEQLESSEAQREAARAAAGTAAGSSPQDRELDNLRYLDFELERVAIWDDERAILGYKIENLTQEIDYLRDIIARVAPSSTRNNLENLLRDREFLLQNANKKLEEQQALRREHGEKLETFKRERERLRKQTQAYSDELDQRTLPIEEQEREILDKIGASVEKMGEIIAASQSIKGGVHRDLKERIEVVQRTEDLLQRENMALMKLKDVESRIDQKRISQARIFAVSLIVLGMGFAGVGTLVVLFLLDVL